MNRITLIVALFAFSLAACDPKPAATPAAETPAATPAAPAAETSTAASAPAPAEPAKH